MKKYVLPVLIVLSILVSVFGITLARAAINFNDPGFANTWNRVDKPVEELPGLGRGQTWGPIIQGSEGIKTEPYNGTTRTVQYFDKARMEVNNPSGDPTNRYYVTTGLLVKELVTGLRQDGDNTFTSLPPSLTQIAGDPNDYGYVNRVAPTYASFKAVATSVGNENGFDPLIGRVVGSYTSLENYSVLPVQTRLNADWDPVTRHNVPDVFIDYGKQTGLIWDGSQYVLGPVFYDDNSLYVRGRPITEAYWIKAVVGGTEKPVMVQLFERRVLTYTPSNPEGFKVEMGNVGQHYYKWRYGSPTSLPKLTPTWTIGGDPNSLNRSDVMALDSQKNVYILGSNESGFAVNRYDQQGHFNNKYQVDNCSPVEPNAMVFAPQDRFIYILQSKINGLGGCVKKYDPQFNLLTSWGSAGNGNGQFSGPVDLAVDDSGNVYVADNGNNRIQKFDSQGQFLFSFGTKGDQDGQFRSLQSVVVDHAGNIFTLDHTLYAYPTLTNIPVKVRLQKFNSQGQYLQQWSATGQNPQGPYIYTYPRGLKVDKQNTIFILDSYSGRYGKSLTVVQFDNNCQYLGKQDYKNVTYSMALDAQNNLYYLDDYEKYIYNYSPQGILVNKWLYNNHGNSQFSTPKAITTGPGNYIYVADTGNYRVQKIDSSGGFVLSWGSYGGGPGQFGELIGIAVDQQGNVYTSEKILNNDGEAISQRIQKFSNQGQYLLEWTGSVAGLSTSYLPSGLTVDRQGYVYLVDNLDGIQKFDNQGHLVLRWEPRPPKGVHSASARRIVADSQNNLYVFESESNQIYKYNSNGEFLTSWHRGGILPESKDGEFQQWPTLAVDSQDNLFALDSNMSGSHIIRYNQAGQWRGVWDINNFGLQTIGADSQGNLYFTDEFHLYKLRFV